MMLTEEALQNLDDRDHSLSPTPDLLPEDELQNAKAAIFAMLRSCEWMGPSGRECVEKADVFINVEGIVTYRGRETLDLSNVATWQRLVEVLRSTYAPLERAIHGTVDPVQVDPSAQAEQDRADEYARMCKRKLAWMTTAHSDLDRRVAEGGTNLQHAPPEFHDRVEDSDIVIDSSQSTGRDASVRIETEEEDATTESDSSDEGSNSSYTTLPDDDGFKIPLRHFPHRTARQADARFDYPQQQQLQDLEIGKKRSSIKVNKLVSTWPTVELLTSYACREFSNLPENRRQPERPGITHVAKLWRVRLDGDPIDLSESFRNDLSFLFRKASELLELDIGITEEAEDRVFPPMLRGC
ncbi:hypothetical protein FDECE_14302 [Fusarium decemcellulare]|nr:hypothetical protein FDECE_14302 [Fusarium decemcellulare]